MKGIKLIQDPRLDQPVGFSSYEASGGKASGGSMEVNSVITDASSMGFHS